jgi:murein L,D-transpeptidase YcbB/YkuD
MNATYFFWLYCALLWTIAGCEKQPEVSEATAIIFSSEEPEQPRVAAYAEALQLLLSRHDSTLSVHRQIDSLLLQKGSVLRDFYRKRDFKTLWNTPAKIEEAANVLLNADENGLAATDYLTEEILSLKRTVAREEYQNPQTLAIMELYLTTGLLQYASHLLAGKLKPHMFHTLWNYPSRDFVWKNQGEILEKYVAADSTAQTFRQLRRHPHYVFLKNQLAFYRQMAAAGVFQPVKCDTAIKKGGNHEAVGILRKRLRAEKVYLNASDTTVLDDSLSEALKIWQYRHGLKQTGILDTMTRNALNVPAEQRIATIRVNMERMRWLPDTLTPNFILVNVADFRLFLFRNGEAVWDTPITAGTRVNQTPMFETYISHLELNPVWNIPQSIITKEVAVDAAKKSNYISRNRFKIVNSKGEHVEASTVNWSDVRSGKVRYHIYQPPGEGNQLGKIKFFCVNPHAIYLHDTPNLSKFQFQERAFSHGCIRVWNPFTLAGLLMGDTVQWDRAAFDKLLAPGATRNVMLPRREPVHIHYFTAFPDRRQLLILRRDVYGHDRRVLRMLDVALRNWQ